MICCFFDEKTVRCIKFYLKRYRKRIVNAVNLWRWNIHVFSISFFIKGKELGNAIYQRANGTYEARYIDRFGKQRSVYGKTITEVGKKQREKDLKIRISFLNT